jgi:hypothetical protein
MALTKNQEKFLKELRNCLGVISKAAHNSGLHRNSHVKWNRESEEYRAEFESILEDCIDYVEDKLFDRINEGDTTSILFYLKCKAKKRGYVERQELDHTTNGKEIKQIFKIGESEIEL